MLQPSYKWTCDERAVNFPWLICYYGPNNFLSVGDLLLWPQWLPMDSIDFLYWSIYHLENDIVLLWKFVVLRCVPM